MKLCACITTMVLLGAGSGCAEESVMMTSKKWKRKIPVSGVDQRDLSDASHRLRSYIEQSRIEVLAELEPTDEELRRALRLHGSSIVCDLLGGPAACPPYAVNSRRMEQWVNAELEKLSTKEEKVEALGEMRKELGRWRAFEIAADPQLQADNRALWEASGITLAVQSVSNTWKLCGHNAAKMAALETYVLDNVDYLEKFVCLDRLADIKEQGRHAVLWHWHEGPPWYPDRPVLESLEILYGLGVRISTISHGALEVYGSGDNPASGKDKGLTDEGRQIVRRMNELGMIVDGAHASWQSLLEMVEISKDPIIVTHTGFLGVATAKRAARQITDEGAKAVAARGGLIGLSFTPGLTGGYAVEDLMKHVDYAVKLVGIDHVAMSSDLSGLAWAGEPEEWLEWTPAKGEIVKSRGYAFWRILGEPNNLALTNWPYVVTLALVKRGYSDEDIRKILGQNFIRVAGPILSRKPEGWLFREYQLGNKGVE